MAIGVGIGDWHFSILHMDTQTYLIALTLGMIHSSRTIKVEQSHFALRERCCKVDQSEAASAILVLAAVAIGRRAGEGAIDPEVYQKALEYERAFVNAGGLLAAGVDPTGYGAAPPGLGDQRNYELLLEAGFSHPEVVQIMSLNGAKILEIDDEVGTVEAGKVADLVVIAADVERVGHMRDVSIVYRHGIGWDSPKLMDRVRGVVGIR